MKIAIAGFRGQLPAVDPTMLPDINAQEARNAYLKKGTLKPELGTKEITGLNLVPNVKSVFHYLNRSGSQDYWFSWNKHVDVVKSPLADDIHKRVYWTGDGAPKIGSLPEMVAGAGSYPVYGSGFDLGVPYADGIVTFYYPDRSSTSTNIGVTAAYVMTFVGGGVEGVASLRSADAKRWDTNAENPAGGYVNLELPAVPAGNSTITSKKIYRSEGNGVFKFVASVPASQMTYVDDIPTASLGAELPAQPVVDPSTEIPKKVSGQITTTTPDRGEETEAYSVDATYVMTFVGKNGQESEPSSASASVKRWDDVSGRATGGFVFLNLPLVPAGYTSVAYKRIYRAELSGFYRLVAQLEFWQSYFTDSVDTANLGATLSTGGGGGDDTVGVPQVRGVVSFTYPDRPAVESQLTSVQTAYVITYITRFGEEGPPSAPSERAERWDSVATSPAGGYVNLNLPAIPEGYKNIVTKRIYRTETSGVFQFVADVPASQLTFKDDVKSEDLGTNLPSTDWAPPDARMVGLKDIPGGFLAGYFDNTLCFSEAFYPHAWPVPYQLAFTDEIMGICAVSGGIIVATKGRPHVISGSSPSAMSDNIIDCDFPCVSGRSIVDMGDFAVYASTEGLVAISGGDASLMTAAAMTADQWKELKPETIHAYRHDGKYLAFYEGGCFSFAANEGFQFYDIKADYGYYDLYKDDLYILDAGKIYGWRKGGAMKMRWKSKIYEVPPGASGLTCGKLIATQYPATFRLYGDGQKFFEAQVTSRDMFRLPPGFSGVRDIEIELAGNVEIKSIQVASSPSELV
jgi:hypothetical protein